MNHLKRYMSVLFKCVLAGVLLAPAAGWGHGAVETPPSRAMNCYATGGQWGSANGSSIRDEGCREAFTKTFSSPSEWATAADQWHEVAKIPHINHPTMDQIKATIPDGHICAANDPKKASLDYPTPLWTKTDIVPGQSLTIRLVGTILHVPSTFYAFVTRPGFNSATDVLKWSDLIALGASERLEKAYTNWNPLPLLKGLSGFYLINRPIPSNASGNGLVVGVWVRDDPNGEFFISCSDVRFQAGGVPDPLTNIGPYIGPDMQSLNVGDDVHFRIFGADVKGTELVDITHKIRTDNLAPGKWGQEIANQVPPAIARIGVKTNGTVTFDSANPLANSTYSTHPDYKQVMSIIAGGGETPIDQRPPVAVIKPHANVKSGERFTMDGTGSTVYNPGAAGWMWTNHFQGGSFHESTATFTAPSVNQDTELKIELRVYDNKNKKSTAAPPVIVIVKPAGGGEEYPAYKEGTAYKAGDIVTNNGKNYKCKPQPFTPWCAGAAWAYAPGTGTAWGQAWDDVK